MNENEILQRLYAIFDDYSQGRSDAPLIDYKAPADLREILTLNRPDSSGNWEDIFSWIELYLKYGVNSSHPGFVNRMWSGANLPSILGEMVVALAQTSSCTYESAPVSTLMENYMIEEMLALVGYENGEGQMTTGSSNANMIAMMCARNFVQTSVKEAGLFGQKPLFAFVNEEAHYSMDKAANILGIGSAHLIKVKVDERGAMIPEELEKEIRLVIERGGQPFFVTATAGTTVRGAYDPIEDILYLKEQYGFWLHVDGAWGGSAVMSPGLKERYLAGLEKTDSFTCDFHKMLGSSLMCNFFLINRNTASFEQVLSGGDGSYLFRNTEDDEVLDLGNISLQCGRRVDSLKWFLDWKYFGREGFAKRLESYLDLITYAEECIERIPELELASPRMSFNLCFRYAVEEDRLESFTQTLRETLYKEAKSLVGLAYVHDRICIRLVITNTSVDRERIDSFFNNLVETGRRIEQSAA